MAQKTGAQMIETAVRRVFVLRLRKGGATYERIAQAAVDKFGLENLPAHWDKRSAYKDVKRELDKLNDLRNGLGENVLQLECERLNEMQLALWPQALKGDKKAIEAILSIMERRTKMLGLDKPQRQVVTGQVFSHKTARELTDDELMAIASGDIPTSSGAGDSGS